MYTKEQRLEMLKEMWREFNEAFWNASKEGRNKDASLALSKLKAVNNLMALLED